MARRIFSFAVGLSRSSSTTASSNAAGKPLAASQREKIRAKLSASDEAWAQRQGQLSLHKIRMREDSGQFNQTASNASLPQSEQHQILTDSFQRRHTYLRISLTERCNLRCTYCMPEEGVPLQPADNLMKTDEIIRLASLFVRAGVTKIRLTGGEPTLRKDLVPLVGELAKLKGFGLEKIGMTTNGLVLKRFLPDLVQAGIDSVNISLDTLRADRFLKIARRPGLQNVLESVHAATRLGIDVVKVNVVVMKGVNDDEVLDFVEMTRDHPVHARFIEYMPFDGNQWSEGKMISFQELLNRVKERHPDLLKLKDGDNDTTKTFKVPNHRGTIGFISSMSDHFCSSCNRLRLTADGNLKVCLFGNAEVSLVKLMREGVTDEALLCAIGTAVGRKKAQHADSKSDRFRQMTAWIQSTKKSRFPTEFNRKQRLASLAYATMSSSSSSSVSRPPSCLPSSSSSSSSTHAQSIIAAALTTPNHATNQQNELSLGPVQQQHQQPSFLTHVDRQQQLHMVDVGSKPITNRIAIATGRLIMSSHAAQLVRENALAKGSVFAVCQVAGIQAAKLTSQLIPLCHPLPLSSVNVHVSVGEHEDEAEKEKEKDEKEKDEKEKDEKEKDEKETDERGQGAESNEAMRKEEKDLKSRRRHHLIVVGEARTVGQTGVEMEALNAVWGALACGWDMIKGVDKSLRIEDVRVVHKSGGRSGSWTEDGWLDPRSCS